MDAWGQPTRPLLLSLMASRAAQRLLPLVNATRYYQTYIEKYIYDIQVCGYVGTTTHLHTAVFGVGLKPTPSY